MTGLVEELETWLRERPLWLQDAGRRYLATGELTAEDLNELLAICKKEAGVAVLEKEALRAEPVPAGALDKEDHGHVVRLRAISEVAGINKLAPRNPLQFSDNNLTIIYGQNGAGKSGYVRLLKHICGARNPGALLPNAFSEPPRRQGCRVNYLFDGLEQSVEWGVADGVVGQLAPVQIFDTACAYVYVNDENEIAYEPGVLSLFSVLTEVSDDLSGRIDQEMLFLPAAKPALPPQSVGTPTGTWYAQVSHSTTIDDIALHCSWDEGREAQLDAIRTRLASPDPRIQAAQQRRAKRHLDQLCKQLGAALSRLSAASCKDYLLSKKDALAKRKAATEDAEKIFANAPLEGVGQESWRLLWSAARAYSEQHAYQDKEYPHIDEGSRCVLCQQLLDGEAKTRLGDFDTFVKGELEGIAAATEKQFSKLDEDVSHIPDAAHLEQQLDAAKIDGEAREAIIALGGRVQARVKELRETDLDASFVDLDGAEVVENLNQKSESYEVLAQQLDADAEGENREFLRRQVSELEARKWVSEQEEAIASEVGRLKKRKELEDTKRLLGTQALSRKKSDLTDALVTEAYIRRFKDEVTALGAQRIDVQLQKTRTRKGRSYHQIQINNNVLGLPASEVLSEGEFRIISLAGFLADVEGHTDKSAFIFDDPISSLDQDYEEAMARRLVDLSKGRQVIVFTHRLSMLALLEEAANKEGLTPDVVGLQCEPWGAGEPGNAPILAQKPKNAINTLLDKVAKARKALEERGSEEYEWLAKGICSYTRITLEKLIENELLADVVQRFRRSVTTQGKIHKIARVTEDDCRYIDELMTKYSRHEHSQPDEAPVQLPSPDELETDLTALRDWRDKFEKR